jgi:D-3-phosphoglycerate dehydrogenase
VIGKKITVLFTEPEVFIPRLQSSIPTSWDCKFEKFSNESALVEWYRENPCEIIFARLGISFSSYFFKECKKLKILATPTTGLDHIDLAAASKAGVKVLSLRGEVKFLQNITSTAEHAWSLLLACNRKIPELIARTKSGSWARSDLQLHQISGQTLGIIGFGRLGKILAEYALAFRMPVLVYDPHISPNKFPHHVMQVSLKKLLKKADHIILVASYNIGDPPILGRDQIFSMKPNSTFINVARGELVDEAALKEALDVGLLRSVGLDVLSGDSNWSQDHLVSSSLIDQSQKLPQILITPHVGGYTLEAIEATRRFIINRVDRIIQIQKGNN